MSDTTPRSRFETWLAAELRRPVAIDAGGPARVMSLVHASSRRGSHGRRSATPAAAFAFAACVVGVIAFRMATLLAPATGVGGFQVGDAGLQDTISAFRDSMEGTARLVGVAVIGPVAARMAVVHDFHGWDLHVLPTVPPNGRSLRAGALGITPGLSLSPVTHAASRDLADTVVRGTITDSTPERR